MRDGRMANAQLTNYIIPTPLDTPPIDIVILERPYAHGPFGAKGVGEMPIDGPAPAVVNALAPLRLRRARDSRDAGAVDDSRRPPTSREGAASSDSRSDIDDRISQRQAATARRASDEAAARRPARGLRPHRHQGRLRRRRVRRVHGAHRRRAGQLVPGSGGACWTAATVRDDRRVARARRRCIRCRRRSSTRAARSAASARRDDHGGAAAHGAARSPTRSRRRWPAICAAAPATRRSIRSVQRGEGRAQGRKRGSRDDDARDLAALAAAPAHARDALAMLRDEGPLTPLAGCTDVYVGLQFGTLDQRRFIDLWPLDELRGITPRQGRCRASAR